jgi:hypothetical protein
MADDKDRLWTEHQARVKLLAQRIVDDRKAVRESVGMGGKRLNSVEKILRYQQAGVQGHLDLLQRLQQKYGLPPDGIPKDYLRDDAAMWARVRKVVEEGAG